MTKNRFEKELIPIIEEVYLSKGLQIPKYNITILKNEVSIAIDSETHYLEFEKFTSLMEEIKKEVKKYGLIKEKETFFYNFYVMDFKY